MAPAEVVEQALEHGARSVAYTYVEPTVFLEYALDTARLARQAGLRNLFITDGYATPEAVSLLAPVIDAANVDLKSFDDRFYRKVCGARLRPVLDSIVAMRREGIWLELTTLIIPGQNDDDGELRALTGWIMEHLGAETPWHVSRFFPAYRWLDVPPTPSRSLRRAADLGREAGLRHVYVGNAPELGLEDTSCAGCGRLLIERSGYRVRVHLTSDGACPACGRSLAGRGLARQSDAIGPHPCSDAVIRCSRGCRPHPAPRSGHRRWPGRSIHAIPESWLGLVDRLLVAADARAPVAGPDAPLAERPLAGLLVPHAGLIYSGVVAAAGWRLIGQAWPDDPLTVVLLGTDHAAGWLRGVAVWETGAWRTPLGDVTVDARVAEQILDIGPPFIIDRAAHLGEHSLEVQLPLLQHGRAADADRPAVGRCRHRRRCDHGRANGSASSLPGPGLRVSRWSWPSARTWRTTRRARTARERRPSCCRRSWASTRSHSPWPSGSWWRGGGPGLVCGMCGIQPTVLGLAALRAAGATRGHLLAAATSADAGGPANRSVGYLAVAFSS